MWSFYALIIGFVLDLILGDPHGLPHPVIGIGKLISFFDKTLRRIFPKSTGGEIAAGAVLWVLVTVISTGLTILILWICHSISPILRLAVESILCWQVLAVKSLRVEAMKVYTALKTQGIAAARKAVSMIVGRDVERLDETGVAKAAVETVAENTSDGVIAPLLFLAIGGAPLGIFYKAVNTMDSMLGYVEMPYKNIGLVPAKADDAINFIPARLSAFLMLIAGAVLGMDAGSGFRIFKRDRYKHASPNSAQTESVCAGLLGVQLAGDAWYYGVLHKKEFIGDAKRPVEYDDIPRACRLMTATAVISLVIFGGVKLICLFI